MLRSGLVSSGRGPREKHVLYRELSIGSRLVGSFTFSNYLSTAALTAGIFIDLVSGCVVSLFLLLLLLLLRGIVPCWVSSCCVA